MPVAINDDTSEHAETKTSQVFKEKGVTVNLSTGMRPGHSNVSPKQRRLWFEQMTCLNAALCVIATGVLKF